MEANWPVSRDNLDWDPPSSPSRNDTINVDIAIDNKSAFVEVSLILVVFVALAALAAIWLCQSNRESSTTRYTSQVGTGQSSSERTIAKDLRARHILETLKANGQQLVSRNAIVGAAPFSHLHSYCSPFHVIFNT